jgi:hypothetical protein
VPFVVFWNLLQVKMPNLLPAKEQVKAAVLVSRTEGHFLATKGLADVKEMSLKFDLALGSHQADKILGKVLNFRQFGRHPIFRSLILNSVFGNFLSADFEGVTQQKVGAWRVYRPNLFSESMIFG